MSPYCSRHAGYHDDVRYPNECAEMDAADRRRALVADREARAERIARRIADTGWLDDQETITGPTKAQKYNLRLNAARAAALQALTESEQA